MVSCPDLRSAAISRRIIRIWASLRFLKSFILAVVNFSSVLLKRRRKRSYINKKWRACERGNILIPFGWFKACSEKNRQSRIDLFLEQTWSGSSSTTIVQRHHHQTTERRRSGGSEVLWFVNIQICNGNLIISIFPPVGVVDSCYCVIFEIYPIGWKLIEYIILL